MILIFIYNDFGCFHLYHNRKELRFYIRYFLKFEIVDLFDFCLNIFLTLRILINVYILYNAFDLFNIWNYCIMYRNNIFFFLFFFFEFKINLKCFRYFFIKKLYNTIFIVILNRNLEFYFLLFYIVFYSFCYLFNLFNFLLFNHLLSFVAHCFLLI